MDPCRRRYAEFVHAFTLPSLQWGIVDLEHRHAVVDVRVAQSIRVQPGTQHDILIDTVGGDFFDVVASYWAKRGERNLLFAHYNDLKAGLGGEMRRVARFLDIDIPESKWPAAIERCTFEAMRNAEDPGMDNLFECGLQGFVYKGTNGRWRDAGSGEVR